MSKIRRRGEELGRRGTRGEKVVEDIVGSHVKGEREGEVIEGNQFIFDEHLKDCRCWVN